MSEAQVSSDLSLNTKPYCVRIFSTFLMIANTEIYWRRFKKKKKKVKGRVREQAEEKQSEVVIPEDAAG